MPSPTPPEKVLTAAWKFAREKFGANHRNAMVLHTDQKHPHVHLVVKAESEEGQRLQIDKEMLRLWREDFARLMREQGIAANATPRFAHRRNQGKIREAIYRARQHGGSTVARERVTNVAKQLTQTGSFRDPAHERLVESRKALVGGWLHRRLGTGASGRNQSSEGRSQLCEPIADGQRTRGEGSRRKHRADLT